MPLGIRTPLRLPEKRRQAPPVLAGVHRGVKVGRHFPPQWLCCDQRGHAGFPSVASGGMDYRAKTKLYLERDQRDDTLTVDHDGRHFAVMCQLPAVLD